MTDTLTKPPSLEEVLGNRFTEEYLVEKNTGYLVTDRDLKVITLNAEYLHFHNLFNTFKIVPGEILQIGEVVYLPESFTAAFDQVNSGKENLVKLEIEYLGDGKSSFSLSFIRVKAEKGLLEGICVIVQKKEAVSFMPAVSVDANIYKALVENSTAVYQIADAAMAITYTSNSIVNILGFVPGDVFGKNVIEFVHPDDRELVRDWLIDVRRFPDKLLTREYRVRNKKGNYIWIENNAKNMLYDGTIKAIVMNFRNVQAKKIADHALVQAEQRLSLLLNNTEESFIILNSRLRIVTYNKAAQERSPFFFSKELQSGLSVLDLIAKDEIPEYISLFEEIFKGKEIERESKFVDAKGRLYIFSHAFRPLFDLQKDIFGVFITSTEITERKKLTEEVAINSERLYTAQKIARLGYFEYDLLTHTTFCSEEFYNILEIPPNLKNWRELSVIEEIIHPEDREVLKSEIKKSIQEGKDFNIEFRFVVGKGKEKVILAMGESEKNETGVTTKFRITLQDITDSKMAFLALQTLESKFRSLFEHSIDGVILSKETGEIISANPSVCKMLGYAQEEMVTLTSCDLVDIKSPAVIKMFKIRKEEHAAFIGELLLRHKDGHFVPVEVTSISLVDGNGNTYASTIIRDITEKKKIESEQKALTDELVKNNQDLQQFSFITSHNLRAPVANLLSLLSLFNKENPADDFNQLLIEKFEEATLQLNQTLNDLINVLVIKSNTNIERETISFSDIFIEVNKNIDNLLKQQNGSIKVNFSQVDHIQYNRIHIESIFLNMITNAIRYSSPNRNPEITIRSFRQDNWVVVEFTDNGLGMDLNRYGDRLFGLYQRFHGNKEGKGLGLYMVRSQVIAMGGKIEVDSQIDVGTTFRIFFKS